MDILLFFILIIGIAILVAMYLIWKKISSPEKDSQKNSDSFLLLQNQINQIVKTIDEKLGESRREMTNAVQTQFSESQKLIKNVLESSRDITAKVSQVQESSKQVFSLAEQLQNLEKVLKNQKQRGNLGEMGLELVLSNILSADTYKIQYQFSDGDTVDAIIKTKEGIIPVDAKFSLDNYQRAADEKDEAKKLELEKDFKNDLKKRIDETAKYIKPKEGTLPFAFMFIPAEGIYYDLMVNEVGSLKSNTRNLIDYAYRDKNVIIVSPTTFAAYLQSVLYGFRAFQIEEQTIEIRKNVDNLRVHISKYEEYMKKLGNNLSATVNSYNFAGKEFKKIDKDILKISGQSAGVEPVLIDKPRKEDD